MKLRTEFKDCDDFANYVINELLDWGKIVTPESNEAMKVDFPIGQELTFMTSVAFVSGLDYEKYIIYANRKGFLYDIYNQHYAQPKKDPVKITPKPLALEVILSDRAKDFGRWLLANFETKTDFGSGYQIWLKDDTEEAFTTDQAYELFLKSEI